jgi:hypothetical protein
MLNKLNFIVFKQPKCAIFCYILLFIIFLLQTAVAQDDLVLENMTISTTETYEAANSITAGPAFTITGMGKVTFKSGNVVTLKPGFVILAGGEFHSLSNETYGPVQEYNSEIPKIFELSQNYPNPFNPSTNIEFSIPKATAVTLAIYNSLGQEITTLVSDRLSPGKYTFNWEADNLASGIYLYRLITDEFVDTKKMLLLR